MLERQLSQPLREKLPAEIAYLKYMAKNIYHEEPGLTDLIKYDLDTFFDEYFNVCIFGDGLTAIKRHKYHERISREDHEKILALIEHLESIENGSIDCTDQALINSYGNGYTQEAGLPAWAESTPLLQLLLKKRATLVEHKNSTAENLIIAGDIVKRGTDLAEDIVSTLRSANLLETLSNESMRATVGGLNIINVTYEFLKGGYDFITAYNGDDNHRPELLAESGMRTAWSFTGILTIVLYLAKVLFLPIALLGISIVMLPIFIAILAKDTWLYFEAKSNEKESSEFDTDSEFNQELERLNEKLKNSSLTPEEFYQLASMEHRQANDNKILKEAAREMRYTAIDLGAYFFIAAASCTAITAYYLTYPMQILIGKIALAATIIGVTVATAAKIWKSRKSIAKAAGIIYDWCKEKICNLYDWAKEKICHLYYLCGEKISDLFKTDKPKHEMINNIQFDITLPNDYSDYRSGISSDSLENSVGKNTFVQEQDNFIEPIEIEIKQTKSDSKLSLSKKQIPSTKVFEFKNQDAMQKPKTRERTNSTPVLLPSMATSHFTTFSKPLRHLDNQANKKIVQSHSYKF